MFIHNTYISYLVQGQTATAIQSGDFLVLYRDLGGGQLVRHKKRTILFCFGLFLFWCGPIVVYITPMKLRKFYLQILSALQQYWIFLSGSSQHPTRSFVFSTCYSYNSYNIYTLLYTIYKDSTILSRLLIE